MSMAVWLNVRNGERYENDGEDLAAVFYLQEQINALADSLGVKSLTEFFDDTDCRYCLEEYEDEFGDEDEGEDMPDSEDGWPASAARWHDPAEVLQSVQALRAHVQASPGAITEQDGFAAQDLLAELEYLQTGLALAKANDRTVHLLILM